MSATKITSLYSGGAIGAERPSPTEPYKDIEFDDLSTKSSTEDPPEYDAVITEAGGSSSSSCFYPTRNYQVEARGQRWIRLPFCSPSEPIVVYSTDESGNITEPAYESVRSKTDSGSRVLLRKNTSDSDVPVSATVHRFGPGNPPKLHILRDTETKYPKPTGSYDDQESFDVLSRGHTTRGVIMRTPLGTYQWRYGNKAERRDAQAHSLVVMERITSVALEGGKTKQEFRRVAQLVRNDQYRSAGTSRSTAGNGGRLMMDLRDWADSKNDAADMETIIVASCIIILKKEVDRRRCQQGIMLAAAASGGP